eukprot:CAMPEP_0171307072 /NCGR_PEP_ID=MMETSP0816-20121228/17088_1 /TAXON_ID=420281 /ORGANISM="Proboscia inermis, Strain CCAP1064/1" /LENGTH=41 /DNA_ID= /DNA_START= /DNA_END= /DNA_ORIENTATION=
MDIRTPERNLQSAGDFTNLGHPPPPMGGGSGVKGWGLIPNK